MKIFLQVVCTKNSAPYFEHFKYFIHAFFPLISIVSICFIFSYFPFMCVCISQVFVVSVFMFSVFFTVSSLVCACIYRYTFSESLVYSIIPMLPVFSTIPLIKRYQQFTISWATFLAYQEHLRNVFVLFM